MTQFEKVKQMTIEEFVDNFVPKKYICERCGYEFNSDDCMYKSCRDGYIEFYKSEVEEYESI